MNELLELSNENAEDLNKTFISLEDFHHGCLALNEAFEKAALASDNITFTLSKKFRWLAAKTWSLKQYKIYMGWK